MRSLEIVTRDSLSPPRIRGERYLDRSNIFEMYYSLLTYCQDLYCTAITPLLWERPPHLHCIKCLFQLLLQSGESLAREDNMRSPQFLDRRASHESHVQLKFLLDDPQGPCNALLAPQSKSKKDRPPNQDTVCSQRQGLQGKEKIHKSMSYLKESGTTLGI